MRQLFSSRFRVRIRPTCRFHLRLRGGLTSIPINRVGTGSASDRVLPGFVGTGSGSDRVPQTICKKAFSVSSLCEFCVQDFLKCTPQNARTKSGTKIKACFSDIIILVSTDNRSGRFRTTGRQLVDSPLSFLELSKIQFYPISLLLFFIFHISPSPLFL